MNHTSIITSEDELGKRLNSRQSTVYKLVDLKDNSMDINHPATIIVCDDNHQDKVFKMEPSDCVSSMENSIGDCQVASSQESIQTLATSDPASSVNTRNSPVITVSSDITQNYSPSTVQCHGYGYGTPIPPRTICPTGYSHYQVLPFVPLGDSHLSSTPMHQTSVSHRECFTTPIRPPYSDVSLNSTGEETSSSNPSSTSIPRPPQNTPENNVNMALIQSPPTLVPAPPLAISSFHRSPALPSRGISQILRSIENTNRFQNPPLSARESHNEKERIRRRRMKDSFNYLRSIIPGLAEKTDKATVLDVTGRYVQYLKTACGINSTHDKGFIESLASFY